MKLRNIRQFSIWKKQMLLICRIQSGALKIYIQMDMDGLKDSVVRMLAGINYNKKRRNMNVLLRQCKNKKRKSHICVVRAADMGLFDKDN